MKKFLLLCVLIFSIFLVSCTAERANLKKDAPLYTVKIINDSFEKVSLRYQTDESDYTIRFVDPNNFIKFETTDELILQYVINNFEDLKVLMIKQHTLIHIKKNEIIIDDLPKEEIIIKKELKEPKEENKGK